jgi:hypothetical protein
MYRSIDREAFVCVYTVQQFWEEKLKHHDACMCQVWN